MGFKAVTGPQVTSALLGLSFASEDLAELTH